MATLSFPSSSSSSNLSTTRKPLSPTPPTKFPFFQRLSPSSSNYNLSLKTLNPEILKSLEPLCCSTNPDAIPIPKHTLKSRLKNGETLYGIFLLGFSPTLAEIAGLAGYDFAVVDMEHGHGGISDALPCLHALAATGTPAILRIPESSATWAKKALDLGPQGIMFPMIDGPKSAKKAVSYCRFPPQGIRGSAHTVVRASDYGINEGYVSNYAEELLIMCQIECEDGVKKVEEIAAVEGVDCIQMGPLDLSASLGYLWDPGHKKVKEVMRAAEKKVLGMKVGNGGAYLCGFAMPHDSPENLRERGYHMVSGAVDVGLFRKAAVEDVGRFKMSLVKGDDEKEDGDEKYWSE